jgi:hypothetical protein
MTAFYRWADLIQVRTEETRDCQASRTLAYRMAEFTGGPAFAYWPGFPEPVAGDVYLSSRINWSRQSEWTLAYLLHETGHGFGLGESEFDEDITCPRTIHPYKLVPSQREIRWMKCAYNGVCN